MKSKVEAPPYWAWRRQSNRHLKSECPPQSNEIVLSLSRCMKKQSSEWSGVLASHRAHASICPSSERHTALDRFQSESSSEQRTGGSTHVPGCQALA